MRLGDFDALKEAINKIIDEEIEIDEKWAKGLKYSLKIIDNAPTVVNEYTKGFADGERSGRHLPLTDEEKAILVRQWRPQGEWIESVCSIKCNKCGKNGLYWNDYPLKSNFCPNCGLPMKNGGADMRSDGK